LFIWKRKRNVYTYEMLNWDGTCIDSPYWWYKKRKSICWVN